MSYKWICQPFFLIDFVFEENHDCGFKLSKLEKYEME